MKLIVLFISLALVSIPSLAEKSEAPKRGYLQKLDLSDEQRAQIKEIREAGGTKADVRAVLTEEQIANLDKLRKKRHGSPEKRVRFLQRKLELSESQAEEIKGIIEADGSREDIRAVLSEEQAETFDALPKRGSKDGKLKRKSKKSDSSKSSDSSESIG